MKVRIEFLITHDDGVYEVSRVPCIGEIVTVHDQDECYEVKDVIHILNAVSETQAIVRVR